MLMNPLQHLGKLLAVPVEYFIRALCERVYIIIIILCVCVWMNKHVHVEYMYVLQPITPIPVNNTMASYISPSCVRPIIIHVL